MKNIHWSGNIRELRNVVERLVILCDEKITDDRFVVLVGFNGDPSESNIKSLQKSLEEAGAEGITLKDDVELSRSRHRHVLNCGTIDDSNNFVATNISSEDSAVQAVCNAVWTQAVKDAWKAKLIADKE